MRATIKAAKICTRYLATLDPSTKLTVPESLSSVDHLTACSIDGISEFMFYNLRDVLWDREPKTLYYLEDWDKATHFKIADDFYSSIVAQAIYVGVSSLLAYESQPS